MNLEDDIDINCHCNEPSESVTNQLFNTDTSGGSCYVFQSSYTELPPSTSSCLSAIPDYDASGREADQDQHKEQLTAEAIVECIFHSLDLLDKMGGSLNNFEELLLMAQSMYCKGASLNQDIDVEEVVTKWPKTWADARKHLVDVGYKDAKEYFICLSEDHPCQWDLLEKRSDECQICGQKGTIPYYYLGLETKVKQWVSDPDMCNKMTQHWKEKECWLQRTEGWHTKTELWDGDRFAELSWFWDPASTWTLPVRCKTQGCRNIISSEVVDSLPEIRSGIKEVTCNECHSSFSFQVKSAQGDPRNIALLGHWDGFQPFGSSSRSTGTVHVMITSTDGVMLHYTNYHCTAWDLIFLFMMLLKMQ